MKALNDQSELLENFGKECLDDDIILSAEKFIVKVVGPKKLSNCSTFNELRLKQHRKIKLNSKSRFVDLPCTSASLVENINRGYIQAKVWIESPFWNAMERMDPNDYGCKIDLSVNSIRASFI